MNGRMQGLIGVIRVIRGARRLLFPFYALRPTGYRCAMPSFDIVSQVNSMEIENAVNQARKELANRFDFKGSTAEIVLDKNEIKLSAEDQFKLKALAEIVMGKLAKRQISLKNVEKAEPDVSPLGHARQVIKLKQGIETAVAKQITGFIRDTKLKEVVNQQENRPPDQKPPDNEGDNFDDLNLLEIIR